MRRPELHDAHCCAVWPSNRSPECPTHRTGSPGAAGPFQCKRQRLTMAAPGSPMNVATDPNLPHLSRRIAATARNPAQQRTADNPRRPSRRATLRQAAPHAMSKRSTEPAPPRGRRVMTGGRDAPDRRHGGGFAKLGINPLNREDAAPAAAPRSAAACSSPRIDPSNRESPAPVAAPGPDPTFSSPRMSP
jgi:hypothetical protein